MLTFRNILVDIDEAASAQPALQAALQLARRSGARLRTTDVARRCGFSQTQHQADMLSREAERFGHDLVIRSHTRDLQARDGGVTLQLIRRCPCAVWAWKPAATSERPLVVAAVNAASHEPESRELSLDALSAALLLAELDGADLAIVYAWNAPAGKKMAIYATVQEREDSVVDAEVRAQQDVQQLVASFGGELHRRARLRLVQGDAADAIASFALAEGATLIVAGSRGDSGLLHRILGSTAERLLAVSPCSVLVVRPSI